jgi:hypothetical protein
MSTTCSKTLPAYTVRPQDIKRCQKCNAEIIWQESYRTHGLYPTDVRSDTMQNKISCRNWFHQCQPIPVPVQNPNYQQPTLFPKTFNVTGIAALFTKAQQHLKWPKIRLSTVKGQVVVMKLAGPRSKYYGQLLVTDGQPFGVNKFFGRIDKNGIWNPGKDSTQDVLDLLGKFSDDPAGVAAAYGKLTGNCCFCNLPLSDQRSTDVGYGPVCADHWNLPWG